MNYNKSTVERAPRISVRNVQIPGISSSNSRFIASTPCFFGGIRSWLVCPSCHKRVTALYSTSDSSTMACRMCRGLIYESQQYSRQPRHFNQMLTHALKADAQFEGMKRKRFLYRNQLTRRAKRYLKHAKLSHLLQIP